jgi:FkbM family methyltransferase
MTTDPSAVPPPFPASLATRASFEQDSQLRSKAVPLGDGIVLAQVAGRFKMYVVASDVSLAPHLMMNGYWESWISVAFARAVVQRAPRLLVNVGANHGYYALLAAALDPALHIEAYEPQARLATLIERSALVNGFAGVQVLRKAAGSGHGSVWLEEHGDFLGSASVTAGASTGRRALGVEVVPLDSVSDAPIDMMLIDAEGYEFEILKGAEGRLARSDAPCIFLEFSAPRYSDKLRFVEWMRERGLVAARVDHAGGLESMTLEALAACDTVIDLVLTRGGR